MTGLKCKLLKWSPHHVIGEAAYVALNKHDAFCMRPGIRLASSCHLSQPQKAKSEATLWASELW